MSTILIILLLAAMAATLFALVRGIVMFLKSSGEEARAGGVSVNGLAQNRMMWRRIQFQLLAIVIVVLLLLLGRSG